MKTYERIPETVRAFRITQAMIDGNGTGLPPSVSLFFGIAEGAVHLVGSWVVIESDCWDLLPDDDFHSQYREAPIPERAATTDQPKEGDST